MLNNKGFTLVELLATMIILGIVMAVTVPNIVGISTSNKIQNYAEDAKKFKNTVEYKFRGDDTIEKPKNDGECIIVNLGYVHGSEFEDPPYGGEYLMDYSFVVMKRESRRYKFYVQLIEQLPESQGYRGYKLLESTNLESDKYLSNVWEDSSLPSSTYLKMTASLTNAQITAHANVKSVANCTVKKIYFASE